MITTVRQARASCNAADIPAKLPPMTAKSPTTGLVLEEFIVAPGLENQQHWYAACLTPVASSLRAEIFLSPHGVLTPSMRTGMELGTTGRVVSTMWTMRVLLFPSAHGDTTQQP